MTARMRRLLSDYEQIKKDFTGHKNIIVVPANDELPEKYHVTYFVNGIYLLPDGRIETLGRHEVEITLHADYPRYKPICKILTPIWHPNFRDGQICIGDIWGAGESLSDIIINIGDMIQYRSWNSYSPLSADAAQWAIENKHLFPVGNVDLYVADYGSARVSVEIDLFGDDGNILKDTAHECEIVEPESNENDFEITAEELAGIEFIPSAQKMQTVSHGGLVKGKKVNFKTVLAKGLLWALIGSFVGFGASEITSGNLTSDAAAAIISGHEELADYYRYEAKADKAWEDFYSEYLKWCRKNDYNPEYDSVWDKYVDDVDWSAKAEDRFDDYLTYDEMAEDALYDAYKYEFNSDADELSDALKFVTRVGTALWCAVIALFIGLFLGIGEGVYYGSKEKAIKYGLIGAGVSLAIGFISGYLAQWMYAELLSDEPGDFAASIIRGLGWAIMGIGIGVAVGLVKAEKKRLLYCAIGGMVGAFVGGFLFNYVCNIVPYDTVARCIAIVLMGALIGVGVGLLEQFAKAAWLKVIRGEFEGKEYLVFAGTTSIGNNGKNTIVLFKDKLVGEHHCDINLEGSKYVLTDCGTPMGTIVNGQKTTKHVLKQGDAIAIGNSILVFNTK